MQLGITYVQSTLRADDVFVFIETPEAFTNS